MIIIININIISKNKSGVSHLNQIWIYFNKKTDFTLYNDWKKEIYL